MTAVAIMEAHGFVLAARHYQMWPVPHDAAKLWQRYAETGEFRDMHGRWFKAATQFKHRPIVD